MHADSARAQTLGFASSSDAFHALLGSSQSGVCVGVAASSDMFVCLRGVRAAVSLWGDVATRRGRDLGCCSFYLTPPTVFERWQQRPYKRRRGVESEGWVRHLL